MKKEEAKSKAARRRTAGIRRGVNRSCQEQQESQGTKVARDTNAQPDSQQQEGDARSKGIIKGGNEQVCDSRKNRGGQK